jgi:ATP-dependent DNA helicase RecG
MNEEAFARLLQQRESETLDFKQELPGSSDLAVLISAFYNTRGGTILIGVDDQRQPLGVDRPQGVEAGFVNIVRDRLDLDVPPTIEIVTYQDQEFVVVTCPQGTRRPYLVRGQARPYVRVGSTCREATNEEIRDLYVEGSGYSYEVAPVRGATLDDISPERVSCYLDKRVRGGTVPPGPLSNLLRKLGVLTTVGEITTPTVAGILFFGQEPQRFLPQATLRLARFLGRDMTTFLDQADLTGTIPLMIDEAEKFVSRNIRHGIRIVGFQHRNVHEYPIEAIREAVTNALCHRDWGLVGSQVRLAIFDDRVFVDSPGRLPPGVTLENLEQVHVLRNPIMAQLLYDIEYIENWGSGIPRMRQAMQEYHLPLPVFEEPGPNFTVTFHGPGRRFMQELEARPEWTRGLEERQIQAVLYAGDKGKITTGEYRHLVNVSDVTAYRDLRELCERGLFEQKGRGRGTYYVLIQ